MSHSGIGSESGIVVIAIDFVNTANELLRKGKAAAITTETNLCFNVSPPLVT